MYIYRYVILILFWIIEIDSIWNRILKHILLNIYSVIKFAFQTINISEVLLVIQTKEKFNFYLIQNSRYISSFCITLYSSWNWFQIMQILQYKELYNQFDCFFKYIIFKALNIPVLPPTQHGNIFIFKVTIKYYLTILYLLLFGLFGIFNILSLSKCIFQHKQSILKSYWQKATKGIPQE